MVWFRVSLQPGGRTGDWEVLLTRLGSLRRLKLYNCKLFGHAAQNIEWQRQAIVSLKGSTTLQRSSIAATATSLSQKFSSQIHVSSRQGNFFVTRSEGALSTDPSVLAKRRAIKDPDERDKFDVAMFIDRF